MHQKVRKLINYFLIIWILLIFSRMIFLCLIHTDTISYNSEIPISSIQNVQFTNNKIYVGTSTFNRILVYDSNGYYSHKIKTLNYLKDFWFNITDKQENFNIVNPLTRHFDTNFYKQNNALIYINRSFSNEINVITKNKKIKIKNTIITYLSFNLVFLFFLFLISITIFMNFNKKDLEYVKKGFTSNNGLLLFKPFIKRILFNK